MVGYAIREKGLKMENDTCKNWHAIHVITGQEDKVKQRIEYSFHDTFRVVVPKRKLRERRSGQWYYTTRVLFPGYVLLHGNITVEEYYGLKGTPGLIRLLRSQNDISRIDEKEIEVLSKLVCNNDLIEISNLLVENGVARVVAGPLLSMEGIIASIDYRKGRAKVRLNFLGEERTVDLGIDLIRPA